METIAMKHYTLLCLCLLITLFSFGQHPAFTVQKTGKGKPVFFLPGFSTPGSVWNETIQQLPGKHQIYVFTYAGFGGTAAIDTPWYSTIKRELLLYIQKEKLSDLTIVGHSMGGTLAMDIAASLPGTIKKILLVDALPNMRELMLPGVAANKIIYNSPYNQQVLQMKAEAFQQMATMMAGGMTANKEKADTIRNWIINTDRKTYVYGYTDLLKLDLYADLARIRANTLILGATFPTMEIAKATLEKQYANLKTKQIAMAPDSKHFIMFDQPEWFYAQVNAFLKQ
jgi:pimeloyl-ACP methyl ester carboxylesterase